MTVAALNYMFSERQDIFEFQQEIADWKYPQHIKVSKQKKQVKQEIDHYNEINVTKSFAMSHSVPDEDDFYLQSQLQRTLATTTDTQLLDEKASGALELLWLAKGTVLTVLSLFTSVTYFYRLSFASGVLKFAYFIFLCLFPGISLVISWVIGCSVSNTVLRGQEQLPENAEFLDYEDEEDDIKRKAAIRTLRQRVRLQKWHLPWMYVTGVYKLLRRKDFTMQMYYGHMVELLAFTIPLLIIQLINNSMLTRWTPYSTVPVVVLGISLLLQFEGLGKTTEASTILNMEARNQEL